MRAAHVVVLTALLLSACVSVPRQPYNKAVNTDVKRVGLITVGNPEQYTVNLVTHPGSSAGLAGGLIGGLVGGLVEAADESSKTKTFTQQQVAKYVEMGKVLTEQLEQQLKASGTFEVVMVDAGFAPRMHYLKEYPAAECDAYLDARIQDAGYWVQFASTPYVPTLIVPVRLVDAKSQKVLYTSTIYVAEGLVPKGGVELEPDQTYAFADFEVLKANPDKAAEGLKQAAQRVATEVATELK